MSSRLLCLLLLTSMAHAESPGEDAFRAAADWTVQVRTAVNQPFIEDDQGSWLGAGLLVDAARGWVLTNAHVAGYSYGKVSIAFKDGHAIPATRLYVDPYLDLAVLAFEPSRQVAQTRTPTLSCSEIPPVGHPVGAFGHPWGFRFTGTRGITSAVTTRLGVNLLQTDAPINEGNSGGPLISLETGQVVGINTAKVKEESVEGLSFAVPMPYACTILDLRVGDNTSDDLFVYERRLLPVEEIRPGRALASRCDQPIVPGAHSRHPDSSGKYSPSRIGSSPSARMSCA
jgi:S1-C subfamily serine protease